MQSGLRPPDDGPQGTLRTRAGPSCFGSSLRVVGERTVSMGVRFIGSSAHGRQLLVVVVGTVDSSAAAAGGATATVARATRGAEQAGTCSRATLACARTQGETVGAQETLALSHKTAHADAACLAFRLALFVCVDPAGAVVASGRSVLSLVLSQRARICCIGGVGAELASRCRLTCAVATAV